MRSNKALFLAAAVFAVTSIGTMAHAGGWTVGVHGGATLPMGDFADKNFTEAQTGWQFGGSIDYRLTDMWAFGIDGSMIQNSSGHEGETIDFGDGPVTLDEWKFKTWQFGAHGNLMFPMEGAFKPYAMAGVGFYNLKDEATVSSGGVSQTAEGEGDTKFGFKLGLGGDWMFNPTTGLGLQANWNMVPMDEATDGIGSVQFIGLQAGIKFSLPSAQ